jgi:ketosteroid isomerase-like protein
LDELKKIVTAINDAWQAGRYDDLRDYFHPDVVAAQPGFAQRTVGREPLIDGYRDFMHNAVIHSFSTGETHVDHAGDSAVTTTSWSMDYEFGGQRYDERGWDLLVFGRREGKWQVVWRTVVVDR